MKITQSEIDSTIERNNQWTRHREAMQIMGAALRAPGAGRRLSDILTVEQIELVALGGPNQAVSGITARHALAAPLKLAIVPQQNYLEMR